MKDIQAEKVIGSKGGRPKSRWCDDEVRSEAVRAM